jgi:hypothetical protein
MAIVCHRVIRSVADLREFCDAAETASRLHDWNLKLALPFELSIDRIDLCNGRIVHDVYWDTVDPDVITAIEAELAASQAESEAAEAAREAAGTAADAGR